MPKTSQPSHPLVESLEGRCLLSAASLIPVGDHRAMVYDSDRSMLYLPTARGTVERYDVRAGRLLEPWSLGFVPGAADMTPDGASLYVLGEAAPGGLVNLVRVDLASGAATPLGQQADSRFSLGTDLAVGAGGDVFFTLRLDRVNAETRLLRYDPDTQAIAGVAAVPSVLPLQDGMLTRSTTGDRLLYAKAGGWPARAYLMDGDGRLVASHDTGGSRFVAINADGSRVAMGFEGVYDGALQVVPGSEPPPRAPTEPPRMDAPVAFDPVRPLFYTFDSYAAAINAYSTETWARTFSILLPAAATNPPADPPTPDQVAAAPDGSRLFVAVGDAGVQVLPLSAAPVITGLPAAVRPGVPYTFTVTYREPSGFADPAFAGTVRFAAGGVPAQVPGDYTFTPADAGSHTFTVTFAQAGTASLSVTEVGGGGLADQRSGITVDATLPTAVLAPVDDPRGFDRPRFLHVRVNDEHAVDPASFGDGDLVVSGPRGSTLAARVTSSTTNWGPSPVEVSRTFELDPPGGLWDSSDNGTYTVRAASGGLTDRAGNGVDPGLALGTFKVAIRKGGVGLSGGGDLALAWAPGAAPGRAVGGTRVRPTLVLTNVGGSTLSGLATLDLEVNGAGGSYDIAEVKQRVNLKPGKSKRLRFDLTLPGDAAGGTYRLAASASVAGADGFPSAETNPANNAADGNPFELIARDVDLVAVAPAEPVRLVAGRRNAVRFTLRNNGNAAANSDYMLSVGGALRPPDENGGSNYFGEFARVRRAIKLEPGEQKSITLTVFGNGPTGLYDVSLYGDSDLWPGDDVRTV